ncbi:MAG: Gfo/Idh/MocA family oxidoreductase [Solirubrobacterales bacterium]|nr:Gfo/Idh/MocA family oxidoreductase [Solirubrobacterales bacterium]
MPIEISLLGCSHPHIVDALGVIASEPDLRLAAAWDPSAVPGQIASHAVADLDVAIGRADAVVVSVPTDERPGVCVRAARAGRPILVEKPLALTAVQAREAAREIARSRTPAVAALHLRELPALHRLRSVLRAGMLGRISSANASFVHAGALNGALSGPRSWMQDARRAGVGGLADLGIHLLDAFAVLGGLPRLDAISLDRGPSGSPDLGGTAVGRWADVPFGMRASWVTRPAGLELTITGARATATLRGGALELVGDGDTRERWVGAPPDAGEALRAFAERFRNRRLGGEQLADAIRAQETIERAVTF